MKTAHCGSALVLALLSTMAWSAHALPEPVLKWTYDTTMAVEASPLPYPSAKPDSVVVGSGGRLVRIGGTGNLIFDVSFGPETGRGGIFDLTLADFDGDGQEEVLTGHKEGYVFVLSGLDGKVVWQYHSGTQMGSWQFPIAADLDGDGRPEVLVSDLEGWVTCLSHEGRLKWRTQTDPCEVSTPAVGDIDGDGRPEVVYGTQTRHVVALDAMGGLLWDAFVPPLHVGRTIPLIADLDRNGEAEIYTMSSMLAKDGGVISLNGKDGRVRWTGPTETNVYHGRSITRFQDGTFGILVGDKANSVAAFQADGARRWRVDVSGRGIWLPPTVADLDGDGKLEAVITTRDLAPDGSGNCWYVLDADTGEALAASTVQGGHGGASIADVDGDGKLEVLLSSRKGVVHAFTFGGPASPEAVVAGTWHGPSYPLRKDGGVQASATKAPQASFLKELPDARYGDNPLDVKVPQTSVPLALEVATSAPDGTREVRVYRAGERAPRSPAWSVALPGTYQVALRSIDLKSGATKAAQTLEKSVENVALALDSPSFKGPLTRAVESLKRLSTKAPEATVALAARWTDAETRLNVIGARVAAAATLDGAGRKQLAKDVDALAAHLVRTEKLAALTESEVAAGRRPSFVVWQDDNPWDNVHPLDTLPAQGETPLIRAWAFGNEIESVCVNAVNLGADPVTLRIGPATITREGVAEPLKAENAVGLLRPVWLPSKFGEVVPDLLPALGPGYTMDVAPGDAHQLWINFRTAGLEPGVYTFTWPIRTLDGSQARRDLAVRLEVSRVALPEKSRYLACFWSRNSLDGVSTVPDLNEHLQTIWYGVPLPSAKADAEGNLTGEIDWSAHDEIIRQAKQIELILYSPPPTPVFPDGVEAHDELRKTARRNYVKALVDHLGTFGLGYRHFMWYVEDEPGLVGSIANYMKHARELKEIDPQAQNYANPWGAMNLAKIEEMWPVTDVWQPGMDTIEQLGKPYVDAMRKGGKRVATYTPPGNARILKPLGFFRAQAWLALHWDIEGGGWWVYTQGDDLFSTEVEPAYGAITWDGREIVGSRRWEANRDGIEDFNAVILLREAAKGDARAEKAIKDAVDYVVSQSLTGMPREAAPYDFDYATFMQHRQKIREALERVVK